MTNAILRRFQKSVWRCSTALRSCFSISEDETWIHDKTPEINSGFLHANRHLWGPRWVCQSTSYGESFWECTRYNFHRLFSKQEQSKVELVKRRFEEKTIAFGQKERALSWRQCNLLNKLIMSFFLSRQILQIHFPVTISRFPTLKH